MWGTFVGGIAVVMLITGQFAAAVIFALFAVVPIVIASRKSSSS
jgi:hypothetical protein